MRRRTGGLCLVDLSLIGVLLPLGHLLHAVSEVKLVSVRAAFLIVELLLAGVKAQLACVSDVVPLVGQDLPFDDRPLFVSQLVAL